MTLVRVVPDGHKQKLNTHGYYTLLESLSHPGLGMEEGG